MKCDELKVKKKIIAILLCTTMEGEKKNNSKIHP